MDMCEFANRVKVWRQKVGYHTPSTIEGPDGDAMLAKLMLVTREVSEAAEAVMHGDFDNFKEELADVVIYILDISATMGIDLEREIEHKMVINESRPRRRDTAV